MRLELTVDGSDNHTYTFQFHKGAIRTVQNQQRNKTLIYFNSIKVRLERINPAFAYGNIAFQFHKGAIRTMINYQYLLNMSHFNSIKVRLEHRVLILILSCLLHFNSIKVRLELRAKRYCIIFLLFQFHKGAIRTRQ